MCSGYLHSNVAFWRFLLQIPNSGDFPMHHHHHWRHNHRTTTTPGVVHFKHQLSIWCSHHHLIMQKGVTRKRFWICPLILDFGGGGWVMEADKAREEAGDREESSQEEKRRNPPRKIARILSTKPSKICPDVQSVRTPRGDARTPVSAARVVLQFTPFSTIRITWSPSRKLFLRH